MVPGVVARAPRPGTRANMRRARIGRRLELGRILTPGARRRGRGARSPGSRAAAAVWVARRPPHVDGCRADHGARRRSRRPSPSLLCDDYEVRTETAPATLLDLAARGVIALDEVQPGETICRVRRPRTPGRPRARSSATCSAALRDQGGRRRDPRHRADDRHRGRIGRAGTATLAAARRRRRASSAGLTVDRWPKRADAARRCGRARGRRAGPARRAWIGGDAEDHPVGRRRRGRDRDRRRARRSARSPARMRRSLAQRPDAGRARPRRRAGSGCARTSPRTSSSQTLPPGGGEAVRPAPRVRGRLRARGPRGRRAAVRRGGRPPRVERAGRSLAAGPGRGTHGSGHRAGAAIRSLATALGLCLGGVAGLPARPARRPRRATARSSVATVLAFPLLWSLWVLSAAIPDLFTTRTGRPGPCCAVARAPGRLSNERLAEVLVLRRGRRRHPRPHRRVPRLRGAVPAACTRVRP